MTKYIEKNFGRIWPACVEKLTWFLIQCRCHFDGDLDRLLVFNVIVGRTLTAKNVPKDFTAQDLGTPKSKAIRSDPINLQSIADFSGIPRETARRKLRELMEQGWVWRDEHGNFAPTHKALTDLAPLIEISIGYFAKMKTILSPK